MNSVADESVSCFSGQVSYQVISRLSSLRGNTCVVILTLLTTTKVHDFQFTQHRSMFIALTHVL